MTGAATELLTGALAGGGFQVVSETFKMGGSLVDSLRQAAVARNEEARKNAKSEQEAQDAAAKRNPAWIRAVLALIVFTSAFLLPFWAGFKGVPTSIVTEGEGWSMLWGLWRGGAKVIVTEVQGFSQGPEFWSTVRYITGAIFGVGAVATGRR